MCVCVPAAVGVSVLAHVLRTVYLGGQGLNSILGNYHNCVHLLCIAQEAYALYSMCVGVQIFVLCTLWEDISQIRYSRYKHCVLCTCIYTRTCIYTV